MPLQQTPSIRIRETGAVVNEQEFREYAIARAAEQGDTLALPKMLTHEMIAENGGDPVLEAPAPVVGEFQFAQTSGATQDVDGNWVQAWTITDWTQEQIDAALVAEKAAKNAQINQWREEANFSTFSHAGKLIACDKLSRSDIDAVANHIALFGALPASWPGGWKAKDNSIIPMPDIASFKAMFASMAAQGTANFAKSQQLKATLAAATTLEQISAIVW